MHLLAASVWPTGLLFFSLFLLACRANAVELGAQYAVIRRFSEISLGTVTILIITGWLNAWALVGSFSALILTAYGRLLCLKLFLLVIMLVLAARSRWSVLPSLFTVCDPTNARPSLRRLLALVLAELAFGAGIILLVSLLGITPPPH